MNQKDSTRSKFANVFGLGALQAVYPVKNASRWGNLIAALVFLGGGGLALIGSAIYTFYQIDRLGPAVQDRMFSTVLFPFSCGGLIAIALGLLAAWSAYSNWKKAVAVYPEGFAYSDRKGLRQHRWTDIQSLTSAVTRRYTNGVYTGTTHIYTLVHRDGQKTVFNDVLNNVEALADSVQQGIFPHLYREAVDVYNSGRPVQFGLITLSKAGIAMGKKQFTWDEVQQVAIQKGIVSIQKKGGGWFSGASQVASAIPNLPVLLTMVNEIKGVITPQK